MFSKGSARPPRSLVALIVGITVVPLTTLLWLGWRLLEQDRVLEQQQVRQRVERGADLIVSALQRAVSVSEQRLAAGSGPGADEAVAVTFQEGHVEASPRERMAYFPVVQPLPEAPAAIFVRGEDLEFHQHDLAAAITSFRELVMSSNLAIRAGALLRLGRNLHNVGRFEEARAAYGRLSKMDGVSVGGVPAGLIGRYARCRLLEEQRRWPDLRAEALGLQHELWSGRWTLTGPVYSLYAMDAAKWTGSESAEPRQPEVFAEAVSVLWDRWMSSRAPARASSGRESLAVNRQTLAVLWQNSDGSFRALVAAPAFVESQWLRVLAPIAREQDISFGLRDADEARVFGTFGTDGPKTVRGAAESALPWSVVTASLDPPVERHDFARRREWLGAGFVLLVSMALVASYLIVRAVNREMAVARLQSDFVAAVSHEFRTPLTALRQFTDMLREHPVLDDDRRRTAYDAQSRATDRLTRLVESLLDFGRMEAGVRRYRFEQRDGTELVRRVVDDFRAEARAAGYDIEFRGNGSAPIDTDDEALARAVWNLLENAVKYSPNPSRIEVGLHNRDGHVFIAVRDHGIGIPAHEQAVVFSKFYRGEQARTRGIKETGDLALHDLANGKDRRLTNKGTEFDAAGAAGSSVISPDGKQVAYSWSRASRSDLRVIGLNGSGPATPRILYNNEDVTAIAPSDWSPDGKWIAAQLRRKDETVQIGLISPTDHSLRVLKSVDWRGSTKGFFSPDSKYLAFDLPSVDDSEQRDVFVLAVDGSREIPAVVHPANDVAMGWMPDGKHLLFASDRRGAMGVWALPFRDGKPQGAPELVKSDIGHARALGITRSGALYFGVRTEGSDVHIASVDFTSGKVLTPPVRPIQQFVGSNIQPDWSPDGKYLAYRSRRDPLDLSFDILAVRSVETGQTRDPRPNLNYFNQPRWAPDGRSFVVIGRDTKGRPGIYQIDARTAEVSLLMHSSPGESAHHPYLAPDGKRIFYRRYYVDRQDQVLIERDLASGKEREVLRHETSMDGPHLAPDGRYLAFTTADRTAKESILRVVPVAGGEPRELLRLHEPQALIDHLAWTPDSRSVVFLKKLSATQEDGQRVLAGLSGRRAAPQDRFERALCQLFARAPGRQPRRLRCRRQPGGSVGDGELPAHPEREKVMMLLLALAAVVAIPLGLDLYLPVPEENPITVEKIELGRRLFNDRRLSRDESTSCATCHDPERAFSTDRPIAVGLIGRVGRRNAPALINRGYGRAFFWDARSPSLEEQVLKPIQDSNEMDLTLDEASSRVGLDSTTLSRALASYVRSILSGDSPYDRFINGDRAALSPEQQAGLQIFRGKGNCTACHVGPTFTDERLHNTGVAWRPSAGSGQGTYLDEGRFAVTDREADRGAFKTPTLREVARTAPYMHDGSLPTLDAVVEFYDEGVCRNPDIDPEIRALHLTADEKRALVAFLKSLSGTMREGVHESR